MNGFIDWNCHLLSDKHEVINSPRDTLDTISFLQAYRGFHTFCMMPAFYPSVDSVPMFLRRREKAIEAVLSLYSQDCSAGTNSLQEPLKLLAGARVCLEKDVHNVEYLKRLSIPYGNYRYLAIQLPMTPFEDWIDFELNRILYKLELKLIFLSFERCCILYSDGILEKLYRIPNAIFQFNYRSLSMPRIRDVIKVLLRANATIIFGTALDSEYKACRYALNDYLDTAADELGNDDIAVMLKKSQRLPRKYPCAFLKI